MEEKYKELFKCIRNCRKCVSTEYLLNYPQPGLFMGNRVLFIGQNPGYPKPDIIESDKIIMDLNKNILEVHSAYKEAQLSWKFYNNFIKLILNDYNFSIINIVRCPTKNNFFPAQQIIRNCVDNYLVKTIELINPKHIICLGSLAKEEISKLKINKKYNIYYTKHYSYWMRISKVLFDKEINNIKQFLGEQDG